MKDRLIMWLPLLMAALLWFTAQHAAANGIYVWKDKDGAVYYGDSAAKNHTDAFKAKKIRFTSVNKSTVISSDSFAHKTTKLLPLSTARTNRQIIMSKNKEINNQEQKNIVLKNEIINPAIHTLFNSAEKYSQAGQLARAAAIVERALRLQSDYPKSWQYLAKIYQLQGKQEQAHFLKQKALQISRHQIR